MASLNGPRRPSWLILSLMCFAVAAASIAALSRPLGGKPAVGPLLNPFTGFWAHMHAAKKQDAHADLDRLAPKIAAGLQKDARLLFDNRDVPRIFARTTHDRFFLHGFLTARMRLWQMDFLSRIPLGRLSEVVGARAIEMDTFYRRIGIPEAAEAWVREIDQNPETKEAMEAYVDGVNAYLDAMRPEELPMEFRLMRYKPEPWTKLKSAGIMKYMNTRLSGSNALAELRRTNTLLKISGEEFDGLFPEFAFRATPIIPPTVAFDFPEQKIPAPFATPKVGPIPMRGLFFPGTPAIGSNSWAVDGSRTASGSPMLAGDPHLGLQLPAIWYETQMSSEDTNVYGTVIPGLPAIIIGFNEEIAWTLTNGGSDVTDWYKITFQDETKQKYKFGGEWMPLRIRQEVIKVKDAPDVVFDLRYTHHGPVAIDIPANPDEGRPEPLALALRWTAHDGSKELEAFLDLNRAKSFNDYKAALSKFTGPPHNYSVITRSGEIGLWHAGKVPLRYLGQGNTVSDGADPLADWKAFIPFEQMPHLHKPQEGYLESANQKPVGLEYPYPFPGNYSPFYRGERIAELLDNATGVTRDEFRKLQLDNKNMKAAWLLPLMLRELPLQALSPKAAILARALEGWNYMHDAELVAPTLWLAWWAEFEDAVWEGEIGKRKTSVKLPGDETLAGLMFEEPESSWFDKPETPEKETLPDILRLSLEAAVKALEEKSGPLEEPFPPSYKLGNSKGLTLSHLGRIPTLGRGKLFLGGGDEIVNAITEDHGPSVRMVVEFMQDGPKAAINYPGGQSGSAASRHYTDFVDSWAQGDLADIRFLSRIDASSREKPDPEFPYVLSLKKGD